MSSILALAMLLIAPATDVDLQGRLDRLVAEMEEARVDYHVPGMTLGVVKDGEIVLVEAFGSRDLESGEPMTIDTLLPIGSSTKAFTSTAIGMLVDDGVMAWDDPVSKHLPELQLQIKSDDLQAQALIRDLLCHRTGFPRMGLLWASGKVPPPGIFAAASTATPQAEFRTAFLYNNVMYLAAGEASARAAGIPWETLIETRIMDPLGMDDTVIVPKDLEDEGRILAQGYRWHDDEDVFKRQAFRKIETCAPAGSICSTPEDMARWVQFQLAQGYTQDTRLISAGNLQEIHKSHISMMPDMDYALGWMLEDWKGRDVIQHGGNIDGYSAMVAFMPETQTGFCLLMNAMPTAMQEASREIVWRAMLEDPQDPIVVETGSLEANTGVYIANFGPFKNAKLTVSEKAGSLFIDVPGQMNYELVPPAEGETRWPFKMTDTIAVEFNPSDSGEINSVTMHQSGMAFEMPRAGTSLAGGGLTEAEVAHLVGSYEHVKDPIEGRIDRVLLNNGFLAIDIPGQMVFDLNSPVDGWWTFRVTDRLSLRFITDADGVTGLIINEDGQSYATTRVAGLETGEAAAPLPTLDEVLLLRSQREGMASLDGRALQIDGTVRAHQAGVDGTLTMTIAGVDQFRSQIEFGDFGIVRQVFNGSEAVEFSDFHPDRRLEGIELALATVGGPTLWMDVWDDQFESLQVTGRGEVEGVETIVIEASVAGFDQPFTLEVDTSTGSLRKAQFWVFIPSMGPYPMEIQVDPPVRVGDVTLPARWRMYSEEGGTVEFTPVRTRYVELMDVDLQVPTIDGDAS